jgi:hypothetical protein
MTGIFDELREANGGKEISNELKDKFIKDIDTPMNQEGYYLDAFEGPISFNGIRQLKRPYTKLKLNQYQQKEILACQNDYYYFRRNYCKILTKSGIGRPEPRNYQERLEDELVVGDDVIAFFPRQSGKTVTIATYLLWRALTSENINIGIAANVMSLATEVLDKIKKIYIEMPIWLQPGLMSWNKRSIELDNGCKIMTATSNSDAFRGYSLSIMYVDETAFINNNLFEEFMDSVMPAMAAIQDSQAIFSSTANGLNHFYWMVEGARKKENGYNLCEASWTEVPRWNKDGTQKSPEQFKKEQVAKSGDQHFQQNFGNEFLGSSATLVSGTALKNIVPVKDEDIIFNSIFSGLRQFEEPKKGHNYIVTVDPKIDGADLVGMHVIDVTNLPFKQVAAANLEESYLLIPSRVFDLATAYNNAMVVVENNIDMTIADALFYQYEYEGEVFKEKAANGKSYKSKLGFRTTTKTKKITTSMLKKFIEDGMLTIQDKKTVDELFNFIEKKNGTFSAEDGYHDDLVMSLTLLFAPFLNVKDWDDFRGFITLMEDKDKEDAMNEDETAGFLDLGFGPDDGMPDSPFTEAAWEHDPFAPSKADFNKYNIHNPHDGDNF